MNSPRRRKMPFWILFGGVIPIFLLWHTYPPIGPSEIDPLNHQEEGVRAAAANQYLHGKRPYRDIYLLYGIGNEIVEPLVAFRLFGRRLSSLRRWACVQEMAAPLALYALGLTVLETPGALLALVLIIAYRNPFWISFRAAWALGTLCFVMEALRRQKIWLWFLAGASSAIAFLYSKESGIIPALSVLILVMDAEWRERALHWRTSLAPFIAGGSAVMLPFCLWVAAIGGIRFFIGDVLHPASGYLSIWSKPAPALAAPLRHFLRDPLLFYGLQGIALRWWFPLLFYVLVLAWLVRRPGREKVLQLRALTLFCLLYFSVALGRSDFEHWLKGTTGYWLLMVAVTEWAWVAGSWGLAVLLTLILGPIVLEGAASTIAVPHLRLWRAAIHSFHAPADEILTRLGPRTLPPGELERWRGIIQRIHRYASPGDYAYMFCDYPTLYFLSDTVNPTRYADLNYILSPGMESEAIAALKQYPPQVIVGEGSEDHLIIPPYGTLIGRYIQDHFHPVDAFQGFVFYRPREMQKRN